MKNKYKFQENYFTVDVYGENYSYADLFELIGKQCFMTTFIIKENSATFQLYGNCITGTIFYSKEEFELLKNNIDDVSFENVVKLKIDTPFSDYNQNLREELKYGGINICDIDMITFNPYTSNIEYHESGEKKVPNIIKIPLKNYHLFDENALYQHLIVSRINAGNEILEYEKEKYIGIILGLNERRIDKNILEYLGFTEESISTNDNIWYHYYKTKEKSRSINTDEQKKLNELFAVLIAQKYVKLIAEIQRSGVKSKELFATDSIRNIVIPSLIDFEPDILLFNKKPIYWDVESYLHIVFRHIKSIQIGNFKNKTPFPYKFEDLKILIEKILHIMEDEIQNHFTENPGKAFRRSGSMSIPFNGDYYCLQIDQNGKLITIYIKG